MIAKKWLIKRFEVNFSKHRTYHNLTWYQSRGEAKAQARARARAITEGCWRNLKEVMGSSAHFPAEDKLCEKFDYHGWNMSLDLTLEE